VDGSDGEDSQINQTGGDTMATTNEMIQVRETLEADAKGAEKVKRLKRNLDRANKASKLIRLIDDSSTHTDWGYEQGLELRRMRKELNRFAGRIADLLLVNGSLGGS
jgi:hypothetical protein